jgi:hypothetical protein
MHNFGELTAGEINTGPITSNQWKINNSLNAQQQINSYFNTQGVNFTYILRVAFVYISTI